jgi:hypothetical protein
MISSSPSTPSQGDLSHLACSSPDRVKNDHRLLAEHGDSPTLFPKLRDDLGIESVALTHFKLHPAALRVRALACEKG